MVVTLAAVFIFLLGLIIGSFLNVVIYRYNTGKGVNGRSECMSCGKTLKWHELVPVVSFAVQKGKCRKCKSKLSWQYPAVELVMALIFLLTYLFYESRGLFTVPTVMISFVIMLVVWSLLVVIFVYDLKHKIIPDGLVYAVALAGLVRIFLTVPYHPTYIFYLTCLAGPILFLPFFLLWLVSRGRWIGLGDGKLALGIGWVLGLGYGISAIFIAFWIGAAVSIALMVIMRLKSGGSQLTMKSEIPFAPYLILGFAVAFFLMIDVIGLHTLFNL